MDVRLLWVLCVVR